MSDFPPSINAGKLFERMSTKGTVYLSGYFGSIRITALKSRETDQDGHPIWNLMIAEAPARDRSKTNDSAKTRS
jgi:hypothetical protein